MRVPSFTAEIPVIPTVESRVAKPNYGHAKRQKETARKARQQKKQERRQARVPDPGAPPAPAGTTDPEGEQAP